MTREPRLRTAHGAFRGGLLGLAVLLANAAIAYAQPTLQDYVRAQGLREAQEALVNNVPGAATWIEDTHRFVYRRSQPDGAVFVMVDADTQEKSPAFDHARVAAALSEATGNSYTSTRLPFQTFTFLAEENAIVATVDGRRWTCRIGDEVKCTSPESTPPGEIRRSITGPVRADFPTAPRPMPSPDGQWEAVIDNYNVAVRRKGEKALTRLSTDGSEGNYYDPDSIAWSPDSTKLAAYRVRPGHRRLVHYVESSPEDQLQPKHWANVYAKPGDRLDVEQPVLFHLDGAKQVAVDTALFPNAFDLSNLVWRKDGRALTFEYNQRGHQVFRVIEVDGATGAARAVISEEPKTFFYYNRSNDSLSSGKRFRHDIADGREMIWMSERDGWNHLYLIALRDPQGDPEPCGRVDGAPCKVKRQMTSGPWPVRHVLHVDEEARQIWFSAGGMTPGRDPYFLHYYRVSFDGGAPTPITTDDANHQIAFSEDRQFYVDHYSRVDQASLLELRRTSDQSLVMDVERGDISALVESGWRPPQPFVAKGRDGVTDIWGLIYRPRRFDPAVKYPVIEFIYAGPHGSHVPKSFSAFNPVEAQADLGFIVVQIDGMGTSNRSKAFHDVAWQNLGDAGFPDRIAWHEAAAAKFPWYDISRVGIYGGSAGGQNAMGALLFHPGFYKAAVSYAGCHDNRMDKIWWNEQWMGWPLGPQYSESSNVDNASKLQGDLLLVVGELDTNVDPASTMQVVSALIKANKRFDLLVIPGAEHSAGRTDENGPYGERKRFDFFTRHLMGVASPAW
jgi:dipeptidyl aminopeptidase/acylaminoacyl peptidase